MKESEEPLPMPEGSERPDSRLWRLDQLPQSRGRRSWLMYASIALGIFNLAVWVLVGVLFGAWGVGLILGPLGTFIERCIRSWAATEPKPIAIQAAIQ